MRLCCPALLLLLGSMDASAWYVDCAGGNDSLDGKTPATAWRTLAKISAHPFQPGDSLRLKRGTTCDGMLWPKGSGAPGSPIALTAWGEGPLPRIQSGPDHEAALKLFNQEYWEIENLELIGGQPNGLLVTGDRGVLHHIHVRNLVIHDVTGPPLHKEGGLLAITPGAPDQRFDDILVDGVTAYRTSQWMGILVGGGAFGFPADPARSTNAVIRNSTVHDVQGDGIVLFGVNHGLIEDSVAWHTGMQPAETIGTPNAIWTWMCRDCTVQRCEAFLTDSPGVDGGAFDIDYGSDNTVVQDNYGHDTQGYCVAVFAASWTTSNSLVRNNVCADNGLSPRLARLQGAVFLSTWDGGHLNGLRIENNRIEWRPPVPAPALINSAEFSGPASFEDNLIRSPSPVLISKDGPLTIDHNEYESTNPRFESRKPRLGGKWLLLGRGQMAILKSAGEQFRASGLQVAPLGKEDAYILLMNPERKIVWRRDTPAPPGELGLVLREFLGDPETAP